MISGSTLANINLGILLLGLWMGNALPSGAQQTPAPPSPAPQPTPSPTPTPELEEWVRPQEVRPLPGSLDQVPVFNSNSPEIVSEPGILLSTFPAEGNAHPQAHLDFAFEGRFDIFAHHIGRFPTRQEARSLYLGLLVQNPPEAKKPVTLSLLQGASFRTQPEAPFIVLPSWVEDPSGLVYAGPGSRVNNSILRRYPSRSLLPEPLVLEPGEYQLLYAEPIVLNRPEETTINGRSLLFQLESTGPVYVASLAYFGEPNPVPTPTPTPVKPKEGEGNKPPTPEPEVVLPPEEPPTLEDWIELLKNGDLIEPRDRAPTPIGQADGQVIYGRVSGVAIGSEWLGLLADPDQFTLAIPAPGEAISYPISSLYRGTLGTEQVQSAELVLRYPDTAYQSHGNYGVTYRLVVPLKNESDRPQTVALSLETPIKENQLSQKGLRFFVNPPDRIFFRGPVRVRYRDAGQRLISRYVHLVMRRGQRGEPLLTLDLAPGEEKRINVDLVYPADSTPPQVFTIETLPRQTPPVSSEASEEETDEKLDENDR
ncbi:MAG: DUF3370 domain-containing protein [Prochlorotrichaceae cyanobacterium]